jgi:mannose-6-phosphate isomerase
MADTELYPLLFQPIFKERVWGGRNLETLFRKPLPPGRPIGESWEISDRPGDVSLIANGSLAGRDLHWLLERDAQALLGPVPLLDGRFPLLVKILDAQQDLSLQVHPPAARAKALGGDPKTEMWYVVDSQPGAAFYAGLKRGVTREHFERRLEDGTVADCFHRLPVQRGDSLFLPSGRVHAIGAGNVLFEIQQNSDTTYRVFDWNRVGLDGKPRELHVAKSLASIDFEDFEPALAPREFQRDGNNEVRRLVQHELFTVEVRRLAQAAEHPLPAGSMCVLGLVSGRVEVQSGTGNAALEPGMFCLVPAGLSNTLIRAQSDGEILLATAGTPA